ncbi:hypothetical protein BN946_scf184850.g12 [Trametes cinnabarina]|uniref:Uncharacterized protein n=1 Tax=Pycnoporus cinnabarinus TaxID=5643 RepID=A0A060SIY7_PYCCI|nr:hypothetical protein BN946_scf184850.g12 [Trametes cinnabarina]
MPLTIERDYSFWEEEASRNRQLREWTTIVYNETPASPPGTSGPAAPVTAHPESGKATSFIHHTAPFGEDSGDTEGAPISSKAGRASKLKAKAVSPVPVPTKLPLGLRLAVPLPRDVDPTFQIPVNIAGEPGLRIAQCEWINKRMPNDLVLKAVDGADKCIDDLVLDRRVCVHKAYFPIQRGAEAYVPTKLPLKEGLTVAHLLTLIIRRQYDGWLKAYGRVRALAQLEDLVGDDEALPPNTEVSFEHLYIVAIRRCEDRDGRLRLFPQLEVRI